MMGTEMHRECDRDATLRILDEPAQVAERELKAAVRGWGTAPVAQVLFAAEALLEALDSAETVEATCPFSGVVEVVVSGLPGPTAMLKWTCPICEHQHEEVPD